MNVPVPDFYQEITGTKRSTQKMIADLTAWKIPLAKRGTGNGSRKHFSVDVAHLEEAKAKWELARRAGPESPRVYKMELEQKLDEVLSRLRGIEVALNALMKLAKS